MLHNDNKKKVHIHTYDELHCSIDEHSDHKETARWRGKERKRNEDNKHRNDCNEL